MSSPNINYVTKCFEFATLTKIHGKPTYKTLRKLKNQSKANSSAVTSDLGGGDNDHLGLVLMPVEYDTVNATVYTHLLYLRPLDIDVLATQHTATRLREEHRKRLRVFRETIDVQKALTKNIIQAIDPKYLNTLRNCIMNTITANIRKI